MLNKTLNGLENSGVGFMAMIIFTFFSVYMLWAVVKGNFKFGVRIPYCCAVHPMKPNETLMNSFLFNIWLLLLCVITLT